MSKWATILHILRKSIVFFVLSLLDVGIMVAIALIIIFLYVYTHSPDAETLVHRPISETTVIYDRTGEHILYKIHGEENRRLIGHDAIPDVLRVATIAIEDERFYKHIGVDMIAILRAARANLSSSETEQGASTITQQLVRNAFLTREKTITRKFKEIALAIKIERHYTKEQILDFYLNEVPYGSNAYGAQVAAQVFFNKDAKDLTLDEAALLASLPKATTYLSPYGTHTDALRARQKAVLDKIANASLYDAATMQAAYERDTLSTILPLREEIDAPHFVFYVREELEKHYTPEELMRGGFHIYTTLDYDMQKRAEKLVETYAETLPRFGASNASLVAVDPRTGGVLAMVGSVNYFDEANDGNVNVALQPRQPGSSFKPIVYAAAFEKGYQPETLLHDVQTSFGPDGTGKDYVPQNFDGRHHGIVSMRKAIAGSLNVPAVKTLYLVGIDEAIDFAHKLGFTTLQDRHRYGLSLVLGGGEVHLLDEVGAFAVFANDGMRAPVTGISHVIGPDGIERNIHPAPAQQVITQDVARKMNSILSDNDARSYVFGRNNPLHIPGKTVAAKTGTTQDFRDAWTVGYTPSLAAGVWVGNNDATFMYPGSLGSSVAAPLWRQFMDGELIHKENEPFAPYETVTDVTTPMITGITATTGVGAAKFYNVHTGKRISAEKAANKDQKDVRVEYSVPSHTLLYYVNKDHPLDPTFKPDYQDPMLWRWESAIGNKKLSYP